MAMRTEKKPSSRELLEEFLRCMVCFEPYKNPKVLQCQHTFCETCLAKWNGKGGGHKAGLSCPTCRVRTPIMDGIGGLPSDFKVTRLGELLKQVLVKESTDNRLCDICAAIGGEQKSASHFCAQCSESFCSECHERHGSNQLFTGHHVVDLSVSTSSGKLFCTQHGAKPIKYICQDCSIFICTVCAINAHNQHDVQEMESGLKKYTDHLSSLVEKIQQKLNQVKDIHENLLELQVVLKGHNDDIEEAIDAHITKHTEKILACQYELQDVLVSHAFSKNFQSIEWATSSLKEAGKQALYQQGSVVTTQIKDTRGHLHEDLKVKYMHISKDISERIDNAGFHAASIESLESFLNRLLANNSALEVITVFDDLIARVNSILENDLENFISPRFTLVQYKANQGDYELGELVEVQRNIKEYLAELEEAGILNVSTDAEYEMEGAVGGMPVTRSGVTSQNSNAPSQEEEECVAILDAALESANFLENGTSNGASEPQGSCRDLHTIEENVPLRNNQQTSQSINQGPTSSSAPPTPQHKLLAEANSMRNLSNHSSPSSTMSSVHSAPDMSMSEKEKKKLNRLSLPPMNEAFLLSNNLPENEHLKKGKKSKKELKKTKSNDSQREIVPNGAIHTNNDHGTKNSENDRSSSSDSNTDIPEGLVDLTIGKHNLVWEKIGTGRVSSFKKNSVTKRNRTSSGSGSYSSGTPDIRHPTDITFLPNGDVIVADTGERNLQILNADNTLWSKVKDRRQPLVTTIAVANNQIEPSCVIRAPPNSGRLVGNHAQDEDLVAITDCKDKCIKLIDFQTKGTCVATWGKSWFMPMFKQPSGLATTMENRWVVTDVGKHFVSIHDSEGSCVQQFGSRGKGAFGFEFPRHVAVDKKNRILITDTGNGGVKVYDTNGQFLLKIGAKDAAHLTCPMGLCLDTQGNILVADKHRHCVNLFNQDGRFIRQLLGPKDGLHAPSSVAYCARKNQIAVTQLDPPAVKLFQFCPESEIL